MDANAGEGPLGLRADPGNPALTDKLLQLELYDFTPIRRYAVKKLGWTPEQARDVIRKTKQWFSLELLDQGAHHVPDEEIDALWHAMVLNTVWYAAFCESVFGVFLHHNPPVDDEDELDQEAWDQTKAAMDTLYARGLTRPSVMPPPPPPRMDAFDQSFAPSPAFRTQLAARIGRTY